MKSLITFLLFMMISAITVSAQVVERVAKTPAINYDWLPGFVSITELTGAFGLGQTADELSEYYYGITSVAGYQFTRNIKAGAGAGVHFHNGGTLFPLFLDIRFSFNANEIVPFFSGTGGLALDFDNLVEETRVFINPSFGVKYIAANKVGVSLSTGLMVSSGGSNARKSFINFKLGLELKGR